MKSTNIILHYGGEGGINLIQVYFKKLPLDIKSGEVVKSMTFSNDEKDNEDLGIEIILELNKDHKIFGIEIHSKKDIIPENLKE